MILFGASGHGKVVAEILECTGNCEIVFWDDAPKAQLLDYHVVKPSFNNNQNEELIVTIGDNAIRKKVVEKIGKDNKFSKAIHPGSVISSRATILSGTVIMAGVIVNSSVKISEHCIINSNSVIEHDSVLGSFVHISPGATLCGNVNIGEGTHIGAAAVIIQGIKIGKWCRIGAGAVIIADIPDNATVVGNPGRIIKK